MNNSITWSHDTEKTKEQNEQDNRIHAFHRLKSLLIPSFLERNKRTLNLLESKLMEIQEGGEK